MLWSNRKTLLKLPPVQCRSLRKSYCEATLGCLAHKRTFQSQSTPRLVVNAQGRLQKWAEETRRLAKTRTKVLSQAAKVALAQVGSELNRVTGYEEIEALKMKVAEQGVYPYATFSALAKEV